ncbi:MAG: enoyl-CoA hydratase/isomerase family protein, partial [Rhodospirillaceae bacterium]|nr:enoyl-CoA hydratase/isomerase family protein [Rhodospirillaceae bacterium]
METSEVLFEVTDGVGVLTLNRPAKFNALTLDMRDNGIPDIIAQVENDPDIRALIVTGAGGNFCSGADVGRMGGNSAQSVTPEDRSVGLRRTLDWVYRLANLNRPVIAAVDGVAFGGGFSLALTADFILATPRVRFCQVFGNIGLIPDMGSAYLLPRVIGPRKAKELALTARTIYVDEAQALGIVHEVHDPDALMPAARAMAARFAKGSATAQAGAKQLMDRSIYSTQAEMIEA